MGGGEHQAAWVFPIAIGLLCVVFYLMVLMIVYKYLPHVWIVLNAIVSYFNAYITYVVTFNMFRVTDISFLNHPLTPYVIGHMLVCVLLAACAYKGRNDYFESLDACDRPLPTVYIIQDNNESQESEDESRD